MRYLLSILLIGLLFVGSLGYVANRLQDPEFLVEQTREANLYGKLSNQLDRVLPDDFVKKYPLSPEEVADVIKDTVTAEQFYDFMYIYSSTYLDYWNNRSDSLEINYSVKEMKNRGKASLTNKFLSKYSGLPLCSAEQSRSWDISEEFPECQLPEGSISGESVDIQLKNQVNEALDTLADEIIVNGASEEQEKYRKNISLLNSTVKIIWIAILILVILMTLLFRGKAFIPIGISLLFVGFVQIGFSLVAWDWIAQNISDYFAAEGGDQITPLALDVAGAVLEVLKTALGNLTIVMLGTGAALLVLGIVGAIKRKKPTLG